MVEVESGVEPGDKIVSAGTNKVSQGSPLDAVPSESEAATAKATP